MCKNNDSDYRYINDLSNEIISQVENNDDAFISVLGKFDDIRDLICDLMKYDEVTFDCIEIQSPEFDDYEDEYVLSVWGMGGNINIGCEPAKRGGKYFTYEGSCVYIFEDCDPDILNQCVADVIYSLNSVEDYEDDECECDCCDCCNCDDDDIYGFTVDNETDNGYSKFTYYSSSPVNKMDIRNILREFGF